ncbi:MAG: hypothetical protein RL707_1076, partial [Pseudomonadota bacterium]
MHPQMTALKKGLEALGLVLTDEQQSHLLAYM